MANARLPGEGSVFYREDKGLWVSRHNLPQPDGTKKRKDVYFRTQKDAMAHHIRTLYELQTGRPVLSDSYTVSSYLEHWYSTYCIDIRDSTRMSYEAVIFRHIKEHPISQKPLSKATVDDWQTFFNYLNTEGRLDTKEPQGLSAKTQRNIYNTLHQAMEQAKGQQLIWSNPLDFVKMVKNQPKEVAFLTVPELQLLLNASRGDPYRIGILLGTFGGLRLGEMMALTHEDVQFDAEIGCWYVDVHRSLQRITNYNRKPGENKTVLRVGETKTRRSRRQIPLLPDVAAEIRAHMDMQRLTFGDRKSIYLICNSDGGFIDPCTWRNWLKDLAINAGITKNVHPHMLRHSFATHALQNGLEITEISQLLGHTDTAFSSRTYVHPSLEGRNIAISKMGKFTSTLLGASMPKGSSEK